LIKELRRKCIHSRKLTASKKKSKLAAALESGMGVNNYL
jgi:hypothetical protein